MFVAALVIGVIGGIITAAVADSKGHDQGKWFLYGLLIWPVAIVHAIMVEPPQRRQEADALRAGAMKKCPYCAEAIRAEAVKCRYCHSELRVAVVATPAAPRLRPAGAPAPRMRSLSRFTEDQAAAVSVRNTFLVALGLLMVAIVAAVVLGIL